LTVSLCLAYKIKTISLLHLNSSLGARCRDVKSSGMLIKRAIQRIPEGGFPRKSGREFSQVSLFPPRM
jgi:hypothetical protein